MTGHDLTNTRAVHAGTGPCDVRHALTTAIVHSAPFTFASTREVLDYVEGRSERTQPEYGRMGNPTVSRVEARLAAIEGAERARLFASGMAAVTTTMLAYLERGDHLVLTSDCYKRTRDFGTALLARVGIEASLVAPDVDAIAKALRPETRVILAEVPSNPYQYVVDIDRLADLGRDRGVLTVVDSTFATPVNLRPLEWGVDLVVHSATKYLGGHNDLVAGVVAGREARVAPVADLLSTLGGICDPTTAFLLDRGLKTLSARVHLQNTAGLAVARFLEGHPGIRRVFYPGLASHPQHEVAARLMGGYGGVVTFLVDGGFEATARFVDRLAIPKIAPSLGGVEALVEQPALMSFWDLAPEERERLGMHDNLVRLSLGIEEAADLINDLDQALSAAGLARTEHVETKHA
ncbi:MAG: PLP-dependent aspartate aminotransferase family protein [Phycisphaerae bacterium]